MNEKQKDVSHFIRLIRGISPQYLRYACTHGGCHRFFLILKDRFPSAVPYSTDTGLHVVSKIYGRFWDIYGEHRVNVLNVYSAVEKLGKRDLLRMSSCIFDEAYAMLNPQIVRKYDGEASASV